MDIIFADLSTPLLFAALGAVGLVVLVVSLRLTRLADIIADRTRLGEAIIGATALGAATSLSGMVVSLTSASAGDAPLAFSNGIGGIAVQTLFLAVADITYRKANLEHAAADPANLFQAALLMMMLTLPLMAYLGPDVAIFGLHPVSVILLVGYVWGLRISGRVRENPMWEVINTDDTRKDIPENDADADKSAVKPIAVFVGLMLILAVAGWCIAQIAAVFITRFGLTSSLVGALMTAVITSLPELVTTVAAVRRGALQLAVGGIIGGNTFDTLFLTVSDAGYRNGSLYHAIGPNDLFWLGIGLLMTAILLMGLIVRERAGPAGIGKESVAMIAVYVTAVVIAASQGVA